MVATTSLVISSDSITVVEGAATGGTFTVALSKPFPAPVTVSVTTADRTVASVVQDTLTFPANTLTPQTVTVLGTPDDDTVLNNTIVTLQGGEAGSATVRVDVTDVNKQAIVVAPTQATAMKGATTQVGIRLAFRPSTPVTVTVASADPTNLTVSPATLTFAADTTYSIPQQVTLTALDGAGTTPGNKTVNLSVTATGVETALPVPVMIFDPNFLSLFVTPASLSLTQGGAAGTVMVNLTKAPAADLVVSVTSTNPAQATVSPATLTFTAANYATPQLVAVTPVATNDPKDATVMIKLSVPASPDVPAQNVSVTIKSNQNQAIQVLPAMVSVNQGASTTFDVWLASNPGTSVSVNAFSSNTARVAVSPSTLIFGPMSFGTHQKITVQGLASDDLGDVMANITLTSSVANSVTVPVTVMNQNMQAVQLLYAAAPGPITMQETQAGGPGSTATIGVRLAYRPTASVTVKLSVNDDARLTLSETTLIFGAGDFSTVRFVTLTSLHDGDLLDNTVALGASSVSLNQMVSVNVQILDSDVERFSVTQSGTPASSMEIKETDTGVGFDLGLTLPPVSPIAVTITSSDPSRASVTAPAGPLTSTSPVRINITPGHDADTAPNAVTITIHATDTALGIPDRTLTVMVTDVDVQALVVTAPSAASISEAGSATFTVKLAFMPAAEVPVTLTVSPTPTVGGVSQKGITLTPAQLTFKTDNYGTAQTVNVAGLKDNDLSADPYTIRVSAPSLGVVDQFVSITVTDSDTQSIVLAAASAGECAGPAGAADTGFTLPSFMETFAGAPQSATFCVSLSYQPITNTVVSVVGAPLGSFSLSPSADAYNVPLVFTSSMYNVPQKVTLATKPDQDTDSEPSDMLTISSPSFSAPRVLPFAIQDNDRQTILVDGTGLDCPAATPTTCTVNLHEHKQAPGNTDLLDLHVRLGFKPHGSPSGGEVITIKSNGPDKVVVAGGGVSNLTFLNGQGVGGWDTKQGVLIAPISDSNTGNEDVTVTLSTSVGALGGSTWQAADVVINVHVIDDDRSIVLSPSGSAMVAAGATTPIQVSLSGAAWGNTTVTIGTSNGNATVSPSSLTFAPSDGTASKMVTVSGVTAGMTTLTFQSNQLGTPIQDATVTVTVNPATGGAGGSGGAGGASGGGIL